jgi:3-hydroxybutyrate dehydrogenase
MVRGRTALITGSTSGIGLGIAEAFAAAGMRIVLNGSRPADAAETIRARIAAVHDVPVHYHRADMANPAEVAALIEDCCATFGDIDVLVNNAGLQHVAAVEAFPTDEWDRILAIGLTSAFLTIRLTLAGMKARGWGRIINIASVHGLRASPFKSAYVAAKHGLIGLTRSVALESAAAGVTVNAICPGYVRTPLVEAQIPDQAKAHGISEDAVVREVMLAKQPTGRFIAIEEVAALALFLCDERAASITGAALTIDGGWTAA